MSRLVLDARTLHPAQLQPPMSKSGALRRLVLARIAGRPDWLASMRAFPRPWPSDVERLEAALAALEGPVPSDGRDIDLGDGAAPLRIVMAQAAISTGTYRLQGSARLGARPHAPLADALREALGSRGLRLKFGAPWPIEIVGTADTGPARFRTAGSESSQFATALLLAAAALAAREKRPWTVEFASTIPSRGYLDLTARSLSEAGFALDVRPEAATLGAFRPASAVPPVPADWSAAGYLLPLAWRSGGTVLGVDLGSDHPDRSVVDLLAGIGLVVDGDPESGIRVTGVAGGGLRASARLCPDLIPTLAAVACVLPAPSTFTDLSILRLKESDRLEGIRALVAAAGGRTEEVDGEALRVMPPSERRAELTFESRGDHRLAMAAATLAVCAGARLSLGDPDCVAKSFPGFYDQLGRAGVRFG